MSETKGFMDIVNEICCQDGRYTIDAYAFVREALDYTGKTLKKPSSGPERHVSGSELLQGMRAYALEEYGPMAHTVLAEWGINKTEDLGEIVFNLVENGVLGKTDEDSRDHFVSAYDFHEAFVEPFLPNSARKAARRKADAEKQEADNAAEQEDR